MALLHISVHVINLERRVDRWLRVHKELLAAGFDASRIHRCVAVDGRQLSDADVNHCTTPEARQSLKRPRQRHEELGSAGAIGCYLSHVHIWQQVARSQRACLVAEDDLVFRDRASRKRLRAVHLAQLQPFDLVLLGHLSVVSHGLYRSQAHGICAYPHRFFGTQLYWLTPHGAERLLDGALPMDRQVDAYMSDCIQQHKLRVAAHLPSLVGQRGADTDIQTNPVVPAAHWLRPSVWIPSCVWLLVLLVAAVFFLYECWPCAPPRKASTLTVQSESAEQKRSLRP